MAIEIRGGIVKNILILAFIFLVTSLDLFAGTCSSISRTNNSANSILTSTKYNLDANTVYSAVNAFDGGCVTSATLEADALNTTDYAVPLSAPKSGCEVTRLNASTFQVAPCRIALNDGWTKTTTNTTVAYGCTSCSSEAATQNIYVYATSSSTTSTLDLKLSTTVPSNDGYNSTDRVLALGYNDSAQNLSAHVINWRETSFEPSYSVLSHPTLTAVGGSCTGSTWNTLSLSLITGDLQYITLDSTTSRFTVPAGVYEIQGENNSFKADAAALKIRDITNSTDTIVGMWGSSASSSGYASSRTSVIGRIAPTASTVYEMQLYCETSSSQFGAGVGLATSTNTPYRYLRIVKTR